MAALPCIGADALPFQNGIIVFPRLEPKPSPPEGTARHWVVVGMPQLSEVRVADPVAAKAIADWLAAHASPGHDWILDRGAPTTLPELMFQDLRSKFEFRRGGPVFLTAPKPADQPVVNGELKIQFRARPPHPGISLLTIQVTTEGSLDPAKPKVPLVLGELAPGVVGTGEASASEVAELGAPAVIAALRRVAEQAWAVSKSQRIAVGTEPDENAFTRASQELLNLYSVGGRGFEQLNWPAPKLPTFQEGDPLGKGLWILSIRGVRIVRGTKLEVPLVIVDPKGLSADQLAAKKQRALQLKADTEANAGLSLREKLDSIRNTVPNNPAMRTVLTAVEQERLLRPPAHAESDGGTIQFVAGDNRARFGFETTVEGGWSAENWITGKGTFSGSNLLRQSDTHKSRVESESLSFSGGPDIQQVSGSWRLATTKSMDGGASLIRTLSFAGRWSYDHRQLLGNPEPTRFSLDSRRVGPEYTLEYNSPQRGPNQESKVLVLGWKGTLGSSLSFGRARREEGFPEGEGTTAAGSYAGFALDQQLQLRWRLRPVTRGGIGQVAVLLHVRGEENPDWLDFGFRKASAIADAEVKFGFSRSQDFLARYRLGMAAASSGAPLFEMPRLGGADGVRGIEEGEAIGRKLGYAQFSAGPSIENVVTWFRKKRPADARLGPIKLSDTYITGFYDRGGAFARGSLADLLWPTAASGYGFAVELQNFSVGSKRGRLSIGYGYSPDSGRHRHGVPITSISIDLN